MMAARTPPRDRWLDLLITAGLAASVTAIGGFASEWIREANADSLEGCRTAAAILQATAQTPYLDRVGHEELARTAARRVARCLQE